MTLESYFFLLTAADRNEIAYELGFGLQLLTLQFNSWAKSDPTFTPFRNIGNVTLLKLGFQLVHLVFC